MLASFSMEFSFDNANCTSQRVICSRWRHQMETFSALLAVIAWNLPVTGEFPAQRPVTRSVDVFSDLRLIKRLSKQSRGWWFETPLCPLWRHCNEHISFIPIEFEHAIYLLRRVSTFRWATLYLITYPSSDEHANKLSDYPKGKHLTLNYRINGVPTIVISIWFITA